MAEQFPSLDGFSFPPLDTRWDESENTTSSEQKEIASSWSSLSSELTSGFQTTNLQQYDASNSPTMFMPYPIPDASYPPHVLSHASSTSSLASLLSISPSQLSNSLLVDAYPQSTNAFHSRHPSYASLPDDNTPQYVGMDPFPPATNPMYIPDRNVPKLGIQTQGLGRMISNRPRSTSRLQPYDRQRSTSVSIKSEADDEIAELLSTTSTNQTYPTPWSTTTPSTLANGFTNMTLHHRRTSSNTSSMSQLRSNPPGRTMLSRNHRQASSLSLRKHASFDLLSSADSRMTGTVHQREAIIHRTLSASAEQVNSMAPNAAQDKARAMWVRKWLLMSYELSPGSTVPRQGLYHSYTCSCKDFGIKEINSASFGKAVRSAFQGIKTRRLGVRGNSKYHYVSIRPTTGIEAERLNAFGDSSGHWHAAPNDGSVAFRSALVDQEMEMDEEDFDEAEYEDEDDFFAQPMKKTTSNDEAHASYQRLSHDRTTSIETPFGKRPGVGLRRHTTSAITSLSDSTLQEEVLSPVYLLPGYPNLQEQYGIASPEVKSAWDAFCQHQDILIGCVKSMQFDRYEMNCSQFWTALPPPSVEACQQEPLATLIESATAFTCDYAISILLEGLLESLAPPVQAALRHLADNLQPMMEAALINYRQSFSESKVELAARTAHIIHRFLDLHQLTGALSPILNSPDRIQEMTTAWNNLNVQYISDQCALSSCCSPDALDMILGRFQEWLLSCGRATRDGKAIDRLGKLIGQILSDIKAGQFGLNEVAPKQMISRTGFITSQVMRDFTLKSDPTFGLFQLLKTWVDDWVSISCLRQTALISSTTNIQPINGMSVFIPPTIIPAQDLPTAVPFNHPDYDAQYLNMPLLAESVITPRPIFPLDPSLSFSTI